MTARLLARFATTGIVVGSLLSFYLALGNFRFYQLPVMVVLTGVWTVFAHRLRRLIQALLEGKRSLDGYDAKRLLDNVMNRLFPVLDKASVFRIVSEEISRFMRLKDVRCFLVTDDDTDVATLSGVQVLKSDDPLCRFLTWKMHVLKIREIDSLLLTKLVKLKDHRRSLLLPFCSASGLEGFMIVGSKNSEEPYTSSDIRVLQVILQQANCVFDRIQPYDIIKRQYESEQNWVKLLEKDVSESQKELKTMRYWIAHDIKNDLTGLKLFMENTFGESILNEYSRRQISAKLTSLIVQMKEILRPLKQNGL